MVVVRAILLSLVILQRVACNFDDTRRFSKKTVGCPDKQGCRCEYDDVSESGFKANCESLNLSSVPEEFGERRHWTRVDLKFNCITELTGSSFSNIHRVEILKLTHNRIADIHPKTFKGLQSLNQLWLDYNRISSLPPYMFSDSPNIEKLFLSTNLIRNLTSFSFKGLHNLKFLSLDNNLLTSFPVGALNITTKLEVLSLAMNKIEFIPDGVFTKLGLLKKLFLRENRIKQIGRTAMKPLINCIELDLSFNQLIKYPVTVSSLMKLKTLKINDNQIHHLPNRAFTQQPDLQVLLIHNNAFSSVGRWSFINLQHLTSLTLLNVSEQVYFPILPKCNQLNELIITGGQMLTLPNHLCCSNTSLTHLDISNNRILNLSGIENCIKLENLDASGNSLTALRFKETINLKSLRKMDLHDNKIAVIDPNSFENMKMENLNLAQNPFSEMPQKGLETLRKLNLSDTQNLLYLPPRNSFSQLIYLEGTYSYHCCQYLRKDVRSDNGHGNISCTPKSTALTPCTDDLVKSTHTLACLFIVIVVSFAMNGLLVVLGVRRNFLLPLKYASVKRMSPEQANNDECKCEGTLPKNDDLLMRLSKRNFGNMDAFDIALCHLSLSDFIATVYLAIILVYDLESRGHFYEDGAWWQSSVYCHSAGFFLVLGLQLCFLTLFIATIERCLTTMYPLNPDKHLKKAVLALALASAWVISIATGIVTLYGTHAHAKLNSFPPTNGVMCLPWSTDFPFVAILVGAHFFICSLMIVLCALMYCKTQKRSWLSSQTYTRRQMAITVTGNLLCLVPLALIGLLMSAIGTYPSAPKSWFTDKTGMMTFNLDVLLNIAVCLIAIHFLINPVLYATFSKEFRSDVASMIEVLRSLRKKRDCSRHDPPNSSKEVEIVGDKIAYYWQPINSFANIQNTFGLRRTAPTFLYPDEEELADQFETTSINNQCESVVYASDDQYSLHSMCYCPDNPDHSSIYEGDDEDETYLNNNVPLPEDLRDFSENSFFVSNSYDPNVREQTPHRSCYDNQRRLEFKINHSNGTINTPNSLQYIETSRTLPASWNASCSNDNQGSSPVIWKKRDDEKSSAICKVKSHSSESSASKDSGIQSEPDFGGILQGSMKSSEFSQLNQVDEIRNPLYQSSARSCNPNNTDTSEKQDSEASFLCYSIQNPIQQRCKTLLVSRNALGQNKTMQNHETTL